MMWPGDTHAVEQISEDAVFEAIRAAVDAGEYIDWLPAARAQGRGTAGTGPAPNAPGGRGYLRGTSEHLQARALGLVARLTRPPVATVGAVEAMEEAIGYSLPALLRRLFLEVANGGFGPGDDGILGAPGYQGLTHHGNWDDLLDVHRAFGSGPGPHVPRHMLWLYDWGCAIWSLIDCSRRDGPMWVWDPNGAEQPSPDNSLFCQGITIAEWLAAWLHGRLDVPRIAQDVIPGQLQFFNGETGAQS
jgi:hypothetical protein